MFGAELKLKSDSAAFFLGGLAPANRGSLAELGVAPMITAGVLMAVSSCLLQLYFTAVFYSPLGAVAYAATHT